MLRTENIDGALISYQSFFVKGSTLRARKQRHTCVIIVSLAILKPQITPSSHPRAFHRPTSRLRRARDAHPSTHIHLTSPPSPRASSTARSRAPDAAFAIPTAPARDPKQRITRGVHHPLHARIYTTRDESRRASTHRDESRTPSSCRPSCPWKCVYSCRPP